jgi:hypothetical protein
MIQEERKEKYTGSLQLMLPSCEIPEPEGLQLVTMPEEPLAAANFWWDNLATMESPTEHSALKNRWLSTFGQRRETFNALSTFGQRRETFNAFKI